MSRLEIDNLCACVSAAMEMVPRQRGMSLPKKDIWVFQGGPEIIIGLLQNHYIWPF